MFFSKPSANANEGEPLLAVEDGCVASPSTKKSSRKMLLSVVAALALGFCAVAATRPANHAGGMLYTTGTDCYEDTAMCKGGDVCIQRCAYERWWSKTWYHCG